MELGFLLTRRLADTREALRRRLKACESLEIPGVGFTHRPLSLSFLWFIFRNI